MSEYEPFRVLILGSGEGTTADAYAEHVYMHPDTFHHEIVGVVSSKATAGIIDKAESWRERFGFDVPTYVVNNKFYPSDPYPKGLSGEGGQVIMDITRDRRADVSLYMGWMLIMNGDVLTLPSLNWHPSILPNTAGLMKEDASQKALDDYHTDLITKSETTVHLIDKGTDTGLVVVRHEVEIFPDDNLHVLHERAQKTEKFFVAQDVDYYRRHRDEIHAQAEL